MLLGHALTRLGANAQAVQALAAGVRPVQARWRPAPDEWSILEVICHLYDEERDDFRRRLDLTLHHPDEPWPSIDPFGWAVERRYNERDLLESVTLFLAERSNSIHWLQSLESPDWTRTHDHPTAGPMKAGDLLISWVAHDSLHLRQLAGLHRAYLAQVAPGLRMDYAGDW